MGSISDCNLMYCVTILVMLLCWSVSAREWEVSEADESAGGMQISGEPVECLDPAALEAGPT